MTPPSPLYRSKVNSSESPTAKTWIIVALLVLLLTSCILSCSVGKVQIVGLELISVVVEVLDFVNCWVKCWWISVDSTLWSATLSYGCLNPWPLSAITLPPFPLFGFLFCFYYIHFIFLTFFTFLTFYQFLIHIFPFSYFYVENLESIFFCFLSHPSSLLGEIR